MRNAIWAACLTSTALWGATAALAQTQPQITPETAPVGEVRGRAAIAECDRLATYLQQARPANPGITVEQVQQWRLAANAAACRQNLERLTEAATPPTNIEPGQTPRTGSPLNAPGVTEPPAAAAAPAQAANGTPPAPPAGPGAAPADASAPQVLVQQVQPNVTIRQAQPEIIVRQAPPIITVQQPQPEIIVRMPEPDVNVSSVQPQVQVVMPQPQVQVMPPQQQTQANVQVERQQPNVRFERTGEPQIIYQQAEGQPQIRFEPMSGSSGNQGSAAAATPPADQSPTATTAGASVPLTRQGAQAQLNSAPGYGTVPAQGAPSDTTRVDAVPAPAATEPQQTGAVAAAAAQPVAVDRIKDMALYNVREEKLGDVEDVFAGPENKVFVIVSHGGFLGLGEKRVAMPLEQVAMRGDRLIAEGLTDDQIKALPSFDDGAAGYTELNGQQTAPVRVLP